MSLYDKVNQFVADADIAHQIIHGDTSTTVTTEGGLVPSFAKKLADSAAGSVYAATITGFNSTGLADGAAIFFAGRNVSNDGGGGWFTFSAASVMSADGGLVFAPTGGGRLFRNGWSIFGFNGPVNIKWFGAAGDGSTNDDAAKTLAEASADSVYWSEGTYIVTTPPTLGKSWGPGVIMMGGVQQYLHPVYGPVDGIYASVFKPYTTAAAGNSYPMLQKAVDFAQDNDLPIILQPKAKYRLDSGLTFKHGRSSSDTMKYNIRIIGNGAKLYPNTNVTAISIVPRCLKADKATGRGAAEIEIDGIYFDAFYAPTTARALIIGATGYYCSNDQWSYVRDVTVSGFNQTNPVVDLIECRHFYFETLVCRKGAPLRIVTLADNSFCGDMVFDTCELAGNNTNKPLLINANGASSQCRGIKFPSSNVYGSGSTLLSDGNNSMVADIWFTAGHQFDGPDAPAGELALDILASGPNSRIDGIHVNDAYLVNYTGAPIRARSTGSGATIYQLDIHGGQIGMITGDAASGNAVIYADGVEDITVENVKLDQITATHLVYVNDSTNADVNNNKATRCTVTNGVTFAGTTDKYSAIVNRMNVTNVINDTASGTTKLIDNNLAI